MNEQHLRCDPSRRQAAVICGEVVEKLHKLIEFPTVRDGVYFV